MEGSGVCSKYKISMTARRCTAVVSVADSLLQLKRQPNSENRIFSFAIPHLNWAVAEFKFIQELVVLQFIEKINLPHINHRE